MCDLGVLLIIAATGGLDVMSEEAINSIETIPTSCCLIHAISKYDAKGNKGI